MRKLPHWPYLPLLLLALGFRAVAAPPLAYEISIESVSPPLLNVKLDYSLPETHQGPLDFRFPADQGLLMVSPYAFCTRLEAAETSGRVLSATFVPEAAAVRVENPPARVVLEYSLLLAHANPNFSGYSPADAPLLLPSGAVLPGRAIFMRPTGEPSPAAHVRFRLPEGWNLVGTSEIERSEESGETQLPSAELSRAMFYLGPETGITSKLGETELTVLQTGELPGLSNDEAVEWIGKIIAAQEVEFGRLTTPRLLVLMTPGGFSPHPRALSEVFAAPRQDAVHLLVPPLEAELETARPNLLRGLARGLARLWVEGVSSSPSEDPALYFFESGLAEYSATTALLTARLLSEEEFLAYLSQLLEACLDNPLAADVAVLEGARSPMLAEAPRALKQYANLLSQTGGNLAGFAAEVALLREGGMEPGLARFWRARLARASTEPQSRPEFMTTWQSLAGGQDPLEAFGKAPLDLEAAFAAAGLAVSTMTTEEPSMGAWFDVSSPTPEIKAVLAGPAQRAGLRRGDVVVAVEHMPLPDAHVLFHQLRNSKPGEEMRLRVRNPQGAERDVNILLEARQMRKLVKTPAPSPEAARVWQALTRAR